MRSGDVKRLPNQQVALCSLGFRMIQLVAGRKAEKWKWCTILHPSPSDVRNANVANTNANEMQQNVTRRLRYNTWMSKVQLERLKHCFWAPLPFSCCCLNKQHTQKTMSSKNRGCGKKINLISVSHCHGRSKFSENIHPE